jgi:legumain
MFKVLLSIFMLAALAYADDGVNWAVLVAGSNEYYNYRHQADICHAYQVLHKYGIPDERIVVLMYDDIANNAENPVKGTIINKPNGPDVYKGTVKDYTKAEVKPQTFLNVLQGKSEAVKGMGTGKVVNSGPNDRIFVFFSDHGAPGIVAFPDGSVLHAAQLNSALKNMFTNKRYKDMVVYIEACESGSMFENLLPENINIYATTASNSEESSYACYWDDKRQAYLGDVYSVNWMEDSDVENVNQESLNKQYGIVKKLTNTSHVMQFGNLSMSQSFMVGDFQGEASLVNNQRPINRRTGLRVNPNIGAVMTEDVRLTTLMKKLKLESDNGKIRAIQNEIEQVKKLKQLTTNVFRNIVTGLVGNDMLKTNQMIENRSKLTNHECYMPVVDHFLERCSSSRNDYALRNFYTLVNLCESGYQAEQIKETISRVCSKKFYF